MRKEWSWLGYASRRTDGVKGSVQSYVTSWVMVKYRVTGFRNRPSFPNKEMVVVMEARHCKIKMLGTSSSKHHMWKDACQPDMKDQYQAISHVRDRYGGGTEGCTVPPYLGTSVLPHFRLR